MADMGLDTLSTGSDVARQPIYVLLRGGCWTGNGGPFCILQSCCRMAGIIFYQPMSEEQPSEVDFLAGTIL